MDKKKILLIAAVCIVAAAILALWLIPRPDTPRGETTRPTAPGLSGTVPVHSEPEQTEPQPSDPVRTEPQQSEPDESEPEPEQTRPVYPEPEPTEPPVYETAQFPVEIENGLVARSIFQFSGMNPDADNMFGEEIAGVYLVNTSEDHLVHAEVTAILADGTTLTFVAEDVPAGKTVMAFCLEHERLPDIEMCEELFGWAEFDSGDPRSPELVQISVSGTEITIKNVSGENLTNLDVSCHGLLDGSYFGGSTYSYHVATLPAGGSAVVVAEDCILGAAEVVRVDLGG